MMGFVVPIIDIEVPFQHTYRAATPQWNIYKGKRPIRGYGMLGILAFVRRFSANKKQTVQRPRLHSSSGSMMVVFALVVIVFLSVPSQEIF